MILTNRLSGVYRLPSFLFPCNCGVGREISEKAMVPHSNTLAWKIPWTEGPGRLQPMKVAKSWTRLSNFTFTFHFRVLEKEMATPPVFLPGESQGQGSLVGCRLWGCTELDTTEVT